MELESGQKGVQVASKRLKNIYISSKILQYIRSTLIDLPNTPEKIEIG